MLTKRQIQFAWRVAEDDGKSSATKCALDVGYSEISAHTSASNNMHNCEVLGAIDERKAQLAAMAGVDRALVVRELLAIATADPRKLTQTRRGCCRHCYGIEHKREWTEAEYSSALQEAMLNNFLPPAFEGGLGYRPTREPLTDCPMCAGEGITRTWVADVRDLDATTAKLYNGVKQTKDGIQVLQADRIKAVELLGRYLGMFTDKTEHSGPGGGPIPLAVLMATKTPVELTDEELDAILAAGPDAANLGVDAGVYAPAALPANTIEGT